MGEPSVDLRARERAELLSTLREVGPSAPTLCAGWTAGDIAAHIAVSEQAFGIPLFAFNAIRRVLPGRVTRRIIEGAQVSGDRLNDRALRRGWSTVLERLASGPPRLYRHGALAQLRIAEEWIHHEDIRRASGLPRRPEDPGKDAALWSAGRCIARFPEFRFGREGLALEAGDDRRIVIGDEVRVRVSGRPGELLLYLAGRCDAASVSVHGDDDDVRSLQPSLRV